jgi:hypothetical protein
MAYTELGFLVQHRPVEAKQRIMTMLALVGGVHHDAAKKLGVSQRQFSRYAGQLKVPAKRGRPRGSGARKKISALHGV